MVRLASAALCALALLAAACGDDEDRPAADAQSPTGDAGPGAVVDLTVTVHPEGPGGPVRTRQILCRDLGPDAREPICRRLAGISYARLDPVPPDTACTQIYGGPAEARVEGTLNGRPVDARFGRSDGCQIERWDRNRALLGPAPKRG